MRATSVTPDPTPVLRSLIPLSWLYSAVIGARNAYYNRLPGTIRRAGVPVISVGNITTGGTGKTPFVIEIVRRLTALGRRPAILTRGYGAADRDAADEVLEFRTALPHVPVVAEPDRRAGAARARAEYSADCLVLDDGFQHRRIHRDLDVVLIDALAPWGGGYLLPAGRLREPLGGLARADLLVLTRANQLDGPQRDRLTALLQARAPDTAILITGIAPDRVVFLDGHDEAPAELAEMKVLPVCGLGNPRTFLKLVEGLTGEVFETAVFPDHHRYSSADVDAIVSSARAAGASLVLTTRKDWVKLAPLWRARRSSAQLPLARLDVRVDVPETPVRLDDLLRRACAAT